MRKSTLALPPAVVIDVDSVQGLQLARILAARGVPVTGLAPRPGPRLLRTRACQEVVASPRSGDGLVDTLLRVAQRSDRRPVLMPGSDDNVLAVARARSILAEFYDILLPATDTVELLMDKQRFLVHARSVGLPVPDFAIIEDRADAVNAAASLRFPCVLKPAYKTLRWVKATHSKGFRIASSAALVTTFDQVAALEQVLIAQEWVLGDDSQLFSCNALFDRDSVPICTFIARKLRQWPPETGYSSLGEECRNEAVLDLAVQAFRPLDYLGLGYLEVKRDSRTGQHLVIEPNVGRPTMRGPIAEAGGVELHYAAYALAAGLPPPTSLRQQYRGAKWIRLRGDVPAALREWHLGRLSARAYVKSIRGVRRDAVLSLRDPGPALKEVGEGIAVLGRKWLVRPPARNLASRASSPGQG